MTVPERIEALRNAMQRAGVDAYILPSSDPHASEYAPDHYLSWEYFSGFPCENANLAVTSAEAALWIDGRFFGAADAALAGTGIASMHMATAGTPTVDEWLLSHLSKGEVLGYTAENMPYKRAKALEEKLAKAGVSMKAAHCDDEAWTENRPALPSTEAWILEPQYAGCTIGDKVTKVCEAIGDCDMVVLTKLDSIAWALNLRAFDVECTPYAVSFCVISKNGSVLFIDGSRVPAKVQAALAEAGVSIAPYNGAPDYISGLTEPVTVLADPDSINAVLWNALEANPQVTVRAEKDPVQLLKAVKNEGEIACTKRAHLADAAAMVRFEMELERRLAAGEQLRECDIGEILVRQRSRDAAFIEPSFGTIAAYGSNAAMMHYAPHPGMDALIERKGFLLVDCGGTYYDGTTDITRTYSVGPVTDHEKEMYTLVLRSHIDTAMAVWREGMVGKQLDMFARQPFWARKLDYRCGTGHSVCHVGAVHEGPHSLRYTNDVAFVPGMVITDEPGWYEEGVTGIRIENELVCVDAGTSEYGRYLRFEPLMYVPINLQPVLPEQLSLNELEWLNSYHAAVLEKLSPLLNAEEQAWLAEKCRPLVR